MNKQQNELLMDCHFEYEGETIGARVMPDNKPIRMVRGTEKMSGYFYFYDRNGHCGAEAFYEDFDVMSPVRPEIAQKYYMEMKQRK